MPITTKSNSEGSIRAAEPSIAACSRQQATLLHARLLLDEVAALKMSGEMIRKGCNATGQQAAPPHAAACAAAATAAGASQFLSFFSFFLFVSESLALQPSTKPGTVPLNLCWQGRRQGGLLCGQGRQRK